MEVDEHTDTVSVQDCFMYERVMYYIPEDASLMGEDDALLCTMLLRTFKINE